MKKRILFGIFFIGLLTFSLSSNSSIRNAGLETPGGVSCKCKIAGGACKANGWGSTCTTVTEKCWEYNRNC